MGKKITKTHVLVGLREIKWEKKLIIVLFIFYRLFISIFVIF